MCTLLTQKGCGYHLDLLMVGVMLAVCSIMGLPWFVAATVLSISHVNSLKLESESSAPGEQPRFLGIREQRLTGLVIFLLMGCSVFFTGALQVNSHLKLFIPFKWYLDTWGTLKNMFYPKIKICIWLSFVEQERRYFEKCQSMGASDVWWSVFIKI